MKYQKGFSLMMKGVVITFSFVLSLLVGIKINYKTHKFMKNADETVGIVIDVNEKPVFTDRKHKIYTIDVQYYVDDVEYNVRFEEKTRKYKQSSFNKQERIPVYYNITNPEKAIYDNEIKYHYYYISVFGIICGVYMMLKAKRDNL